MTVFLSYARGDEGVVKTMARAFEAARRDIWYDHDLDGGDIWWPTILERIRCCQVFVFALSDNSLASRACQQELHYAEELERPILPVRVGPVVRAHANPLAARHYVEFAVDDVVSGFEVLAAADRAAARCPPLPEPLPTEPPIPLAYLKQITHLIDVGELGPPAQLDVITELRRAMAEETEHSVRLEIVGILNLLLVKPWRTNAAGFEIQAALAAHRAMEEEIRRLAGTPAEQADEREPAGGSGGTGGSAAGGVRAPGPDGETGPGPAAGPHDPSAPDPGSDPDPDPERLFLARIDEIEARRRTAGSGSAPEPDHEGTPEEIFARRTEEVLEQLRAGAAVQEALRSEPDGGPRPAPPASGPSSSESPSSEPRSADPPSFTGVGHAEGSPAREAGPWAAVDPPDEHGAPTRRSGPAGQHVPPHDGEHAEPVGGAPRTGASAAAATAAAPPAAAPPGHRGLGLTGLALSVGLGALTAATAQSFLVVPFVVSAAIAVVALHFSAQAGRRWAARDVDGARSASHTAMVLAAVALTLVAAVVAVSVLAAVDHANASDST